MGQSQGFTQKLKGVELDVVSCFITGIFHQEENKETNLHEWIKCPKANFKKCIFTVASLYGVELKHLQTLILRCFVYCC